ncbi:hypothetical protein BDY24DRAFT_247173 [Mrakia frigida]|uniref:uncharacterized protein n=1 Tax=Mrakia frigida TaxID=29902 RepID=UPI003FCC1F55
MDGDSVDKTFQNGQKLSAIFLSGRFWIDLEGVDLVLMAGLFVASALTIETGGADFMGPLKKATEQAVPPGTVATWTQQVSNLQEWAGLVSRGAIGQNVREITLYPWATVNYPVLYNLMFGPSGPFPCPTPSPPSVPSKRQNMPPPAARRDSGGIPPSRINSNGSTSSGVLSPSLDGSARRSPLASNGSGPQVPESSSVAATATHGFKGVPKRTTCLAARVLLDATESKKALLTRELTISPLLHCSVSLIELFATFLWSALSVSIDSRRLLKTSLLPTNHPRESDASTLHQQRRRSSSSPPLLLTSPVQPQRSTATAVVPNPTSTLDLPPLPLPQSFHLIHQQPAFRTQDRRQDGLRKKFLDESSAAFSTSTNPLSPKSPVLPPTSPSPIPPTFLPSPNVLRVLLWFIVPPNKDRCFLHLNLLVRECHGHFRIKQQQSNELRRFSLVNKQRRGGSLPLNSNNEIKLDLHLLSLSRTSNVTTPSIRAVEDSLISRIAA